MAKVFAFLEEMTSRLGGFAPFVILIIGGLLSWLLVHALAYVGFAIKDAYEWVKDVCWSWRLKHMSKDKLVRMAVEDSEGHFDAILYQLEDTPERLLEVSKRTFWNESRRAAERYCALKGHDWDHCVCLRCHKQRDEEHNWVFCRCATCGKKRDVEHDWNGCRCRSCGKTRDEEHDWNGCKCRICGKTRDAEHDWEGCKCRICGKTRDAEHDWEGPRCKRCGAVRAHEHIWKYSYTNYERSSYCEQCGKGPPGGVEDMGGDFCFGPMACGMVKETIYERCEICGNERIKQY